MGTEGKSAKRINDKRLGHAGIVRGEIPLCWLKDGMLIDIANALVMDDSPNRARYAITHFKEIDWFCYGQGVDYHTIESIQTVYNEIYPTNTESRRRRRRLLK